MVRIELMGWDKAEALAAPIRFAIFVDEQNVPAGIELDDKDAECMHAIAFAEDGKVVGTGRLLPDGHIGRMAVVKDWRAKIMGYRDLDYTDVPAIVDNPFVSSAAELEGQLDALNADGGGDEPETLLEALYMLANMPATGPDEPLRPDAWRNVNAGRRFVIVFTDAPFKEPLRVPKDGRIDDVIFNLMTAKVVLHMFAPASLSRFGTLEEVDKALWYKIPVEAGQTAQKALEDYTTDQSKFEKIIQLLAKTMTQQSGGDTPSAD